MTLSVGDPVPDVPGATVLIPLKTDRYACTYKIGLEDGRPAIYKRSVIVVPPGVRLKGAAQRLAEREAGHLERLDDLTGVPCLIARPTPDTFVRQWIDGETLRDSPEVPDTFFPALRALVAEVHTRGVAYADLAKEENLIIDLDGLPWMVDFQISVARGTPTGAFVKRLQRSDLYYLARHVKRRRPDQLNDDEKALLAKGPGGLRRFHRTFVKKPYNFVTRRLIKRWSGAGEGRRKGEPRGLHGKD